MCTNEENAGGMNADGMDACGFAPDEMKDPDENEAQTQSDESEQAGKAFQTEVAGQVEDAEQTKETEWHEENGQQDLFEEAYVDKSVDYMAVKRQSKKKVRRIALISVCTLVASVLIFYLSVAVYFMFHYNGNTYIDGVRRSFSKVSSVEKDINNYVDNYSLTIVTNDNSSYRISGADMGVNIMVTYGAKSIKHEQNAFFWPFYMNGVKNYTTKYEITYDEQKLSDALMKLDFMKPENMTAGENAYVDIVDGKSEIVEETEGTMIDSEVLMAFLNSAIISGEEKVFLHDTACYEKAEITSDSSKIKNIQSAADRMLDTVIFYYIDEVEWELTGETFGDWMYYSNGTWKLSYDSVEQYVDNLALRYDTVGTDRTFVTYTGKRVTETGKKYGWQIDRESEVFEINRILHSGISRKREPAMLMRGAAYTDKDDIGDTYVEVDLTNQHVYCIYEGKLVVESDCVTGNVAAGHTTPEGLYSVTYKASPAVLKGEDYESHVSYWMPFNGGIGLHDATWRGTFGGTIYQRSGSHGCVNLPLSKAKEIYGYVSKGTPVICYY